MACKRNRNWGLHLVNVTRGLPKELMSLLRRRISMGNGLMVCLALNTQSLISLESQMDLFRQMGTHSFGLSDSILYNVF